MGGVIVAIDGPAGAGKSTVTRLLSEKLGLGRVDTGALYRAVTWYMLEHGISVPAGVPEALQSLDLRLEGDDVFVGTRNIRDQIRSERITREVSHVAKVPEVRQFLRPIMRKAAEFHKAGAVLEGRDIGTAVFPDADIKIYLTASINARAARRGKELREGGNVVADQKVAEELAVRDQIDSTRDLDPLMCPEDALILDSSELSLSEVLTILSEKIKPIIHQNV